jgi:hypothetical protein
MDLIKEFYKEQPALSKQMEYNVGQYGVKIFLRWVEQKLNNNQVQAEVKIESERKLIISIENDTVLFDNLNDFKPLEFMGILHNAVSTADVLYKTKIMQMVEKASKSV